MGRHNAAALVAQRFFTTSENGLIVPNPRLRVLDPVFHDANNDPAALEPEGMLEAIERLLDYAALIEDEEPETAKATRIHAEVLLRLARENFERLELMAASVAELITARNLAAAQRAEAAIEKGD